MRVDLDHASPEGRAARTTALALIVAQDGEVRSELLTELVNKTDAEVIFVVESLAHIGRMLAGIVEIAMRDSGDADLATLDILKVLEDKLDAHEQEGG